MDSWDIVNQAIGWLIFALVALGILLIVLVAFIAIRGAVRYHAPEPKIGGQKAANVQRLPIARDADSTPAPPRR